MSREITVAAAQMGPVSVDKGATVERMLVLLSEAAKVGVEVLCYPELSLSPYFPSQLYDSIDQFCEEEFPPRVGEPLYGLAKEHGIGLILPYAEKYGDRYYNSAVVLARDGKVLGRYRKMHIPGWIEPKHGFNCLERRYFTPGDTGFPVFDTPPAAIATRICYDKRFPEMARGLALNGADVIFTASCSPVQEGDNADLNPGELCLRASAHTNNCYVVGAGRAGVEEDGMRWFGNSMIIEPQKGSVVARAATEGDELVWARIDLDRRIDTDRLDYLGDRRTECYGLLL